MQYLTLFLDFYCKTLLNIYKCEHTRTRMIIKRQIIKRKLLNTVIYIIIKREFIMKKVNTNVLLNLNLLITVLTVFVNIVIFFFVKTNNSGYTLLNCFSSIGILFVYFYILISNLKKNILKYKNEILYLNYPLNIALFFAFFFVFFIFNFLFLSFINKDAITLTNVFTFFFANLSVILPSIFTLVIIYFISPALIIPQLQSDKFSIKNYKNIFFLFLSLYLGVCIFNGLLNYNSVSNVENKDQYKSSKITIRYSTEPLQFSKNIKPYAKKLMSKDDIQIPFYYTKNSFSFKNYKDAEIFCKSLDARVPNHIEAFHIAFNYFDTLGDKYYWTSNKDEKTPLVLHFKNMSYTIEKQPNNIKPSLYCVTSADDDFGLKNKEYFYKNNAVETYETEKSLYDNKNTHFNDLNELLEKETNTSILKKQKQNININNEKKLINFSVKEVPYSYMQELIKKGYIYNPSQSIKSKYETSNTKFASTITNYDKKNIRLCFFPFTDYGNMDIFQERQIWEQSFCSPSFTVLNENAAYISNSNIDTYCGNYGGRLPNVPELAAILKVRKNENVGVRYWTNNKIIDKELNKYVPVIAYYKNSRFMALESVKNNQNAYAYCIKKSNPSSLVIANYISKFKGYNGFDIYKKYCSQCHYYEVPDTIIAK